MNGFILNFGHPLKPSVLEALAPAEEVRVSLQVDMDDEPTPPQVRRAIDRAAGILKSRGGALDGTVPVTMVLHGLKEATALILAELHGRLGIFPKILAFRRQDDGTYDLAQQPGMFGGVIDLERIRQAARERR